MNADNLETANLTLILGSREDALAAIEGMSPADKQQLSAEWLSLVESSTQSDPWVHGFSIVLRADDNVVGNCGFKGPPSAEGVVEIAYAIAPEHQGKGYATEAAAALADFAFETGEVNVVRAHTLRETNASTRVLTKCGFQRVGEVVDPDDGPVWRWEKRRDQAG